MASVAEVIPGELMHPAAKQGVMRWLQRSQLPSRFRRRVLQEWAETVGATVTADDYEAVIEWVGDARRMPWGDWWR